MARYKGADKIYQVAEQFRDRCLGSGKSLLWPDDEVWTTENLTVLWDAFIEHPDTSNKSFFAKWEGQLADCPADVHKVATDIIAFYHLFPVWTSAARKLQDIETVVSWKLADDPPSLEDLEEALQSSVGDPGMYYQTGRPWQLAFFIEFARRLISGEVDLSNSAECKKTALAAEKAVKEVGQSCAQARNISLHLLFPDEYERIGSDNSKRQIISVFRPAAAESDPDDALIQIRQELERELGRESIDFWDDDIRSRWLDGLKPEPERCATFLVGAATDADDYERTIRDLITSHGQAANWWSLPVGDAGAEALRRCPYLYIYSGGKLVLRQKIVEWKTSRGQEGTICPWPDYARPGEGNTRRAGDTNDKIFKTWFLSDGIERIEPPLALEDLVRADGNPASALALRNGFAVWSLGESVEPEGRMSELVEATNMTLHELEELNALLEKKSQIILEGPPGSGKTFVARLLGRYLTGNPLQGDTNDRLQIVQFHQSYGYEDFVEGIRPFTNQSGQVSYHVEDGVFKKLCTLAAEEPDRTKRFVLIIDEINRGNVSRIFGELLLLLEYREAKMPVTLPYSGETFTIPENLYVIGTMNTTDRSLAMIDYALRRRFYFYRMMPVVDGRAPVFERWLGNTNLEVESRSRALELFIALNQRVQRELGEHFQVGHSYLMDGDIGTANGTRRIWDRAILPLLEEYFYNRKNRGELLAEFAPERLLRRETESPETLPAESAEEDD